MNPRGGHSAPPRFEGPGPRNSAGAIRPRASLVWAASRIEVLAAPKPVQGRLKPRQRATKAKSFGIPFRRNTMSGKTPPRTNVGAGIVVAAFLLAAGNSSAQQATEATAQIDTYKTSVANGVEARRKLAQVINDTVFSFGELAYQEFETSKYLTALLEKNGFTVERGIAGIPTAWVARWGSGHPVISLGSDIDCLPKASQKPGVAYREPLVEGAPGHGEGHNSGQAVNIVAALAVKELMEREKLPGTIVVWPGVAEELLGGKAYFVRAGMYRDVDAVLFTHVGDAFDTSWGLPQGTGLISVEYTFQGESSHAAARPWLGRNALRAVELMNIGWDFRREQLRPEQRSHYVITNGGDQPNVIPSLASVWYFFREIDFENIKRNYEIGNKIAEAAAMMTDTKVTRKVVGVAAPRHFNKPIAEAVQANIVRVGMPQWTDEEQSFAKAVQRLVDGREIGLNTAVKPLEPPPAQPISGGSDDIGDVSWVAPTVTVRYPANIPNLPGHNWSNAIAMATPIAHKGVVAGSKAIAMTMIDLLMRPELVREARTYFTDVQLKNNKVLPLLADTDQPQVQINHDTMDRYRPQMRAYYYDAAKYDTYLDQLGVKFPTITKTPAP
jgi:aminobenzoyl-glutamate utilization protein B